MIKNPSRKKLKSLARRAGTEPVDNESMLAIAVSFFAYFGALLIPRHDLALEIAALRQQLAVFKRKQPRP